MSKNIVFSIIIYNENYWEVESFNSLLRSYELHNRKECISIYIFDNSVKSNSKPHPTLDKNIKIKYISFAENRGISRAYNYLTELALENEYEWIVFLDQDTRLPSDFYIKYLEAINLNHSVFNVAIPIIKTKQHILSPFIYRNYRGVFLKHKPSEFDLNKHSAINSGMLVSCKFFHATGGYNENLFLDFCDLDYFEKLKKYTNYIKIINTELVQDFSTDTNTIDDALFRYKIYLNDLLTYIKGRNSIKILFLVDLPHLLRLTLQYRTIKFIKYRLTKL
ncbi:MAG: glycosyltransferase [Rikenellaceae bacterium]